MSKQQFLESLPLLERLIRFTCRRNALFGDEADDFESWVKLRIIENDYSLFAKFEGRSSLQSFLSIVVQNLFRDYRTSRWGKWRPSAKARQLGTTAVQLDTLISRDGLTVTEAIATLRTVSEASETDAELERLAAELPTRLRRRQQSDAELEQHAANDSAEEAAVDTELTPQARQVEAALNLVLLDLEAEDRLLLKLRFQKGLQVVAIAEALGLEAKPLYPRIQRLLTRIRSRLLDAGIGWDRVSELLDWPGFDLELSFGRKSRNSAERSVSSFEGAAPR